MLKKDLKKKLPDVLSIYVYKKQIDLGTQILIVVLGNEIINLLE